jgi:hypothetical protein
VIVANFRGATAAFDDPTESSDACPRAREAWNSGTFEYVTFSIKLVVSLITIMFQGIEVYHDTNKIDMYGSLAKESGLLKVRSSLSSVCRDKL